MVGISLFFTVGGLSVESLESLEMDGFNRRLIQKTPCSDARFSGLRQGSLVAPSTSWMLYYLCFTPSLSTTVGPPLRYGVRLGGAISPYLASTLR